MSRPKELDFFVAETNWEKRRRLVPQRWNGPEKPVRGESSPNYTAYPSSEGRARAHGRPDPGREADLHGPRSDRPGASRIPARVLEPSRGPADARGRPRARARPTSEIAVLPPAHPVPRALPDGADPAPRAGRAAERPAAATLRARLRVPRRRTRTSGGATFNEPRLETAPAGGARGSGCSPRSGCRRGYGGRSSTAGRSRSRTRSPRSTTPSGPSCEDLLRDDVAAFRELTGRRFETWSV